LDAPQTFTVGLAWKPMPGLLIEGDIKRIWYSDVLDKASFGRPAGYAGAVPAAIPFGWSDQMVYAVGIQQDIGDKTQVRAGFNYGESPIGPEDVNANLGSLAVVEKHLSLGVSRKFNEKVTGSLSYVHAFNNSVTSNVAPFNTIELKQNQFNMQISYQF
jgi:long-chain fatty acid transport protein